MGQTLLAERASPRGEARVVAVDVVRDPIAYAFAKRTDSRIGSASPGVFYAAGLRIAGHADILLTLGHVAPKVGRALATLVGGRHRSVAWGTHGGSVGEQASVVANRAHLRAFAAESRRAHAGPPGPARRAFAKRTLDAVIAAQTERAQVST